MRRRRISITPPQAQRQTGRGGGGTAIDGADGRQVHQLQQVPSTAAVVVQKAEVPGPNKAFGQDVLQQQPQEVGSGQGAGGALAALGVAVAEGDQAVLAARP